MKAIDILKKADKIENNWILIKDDTNKEWGIAVRLTNDPLIEIAYVGKQKEGEHKINNKKYKVKDYLHIDVKYIDKLISAIVELVEMEL